jgi:Fe-S cluster assembly protein SufD
MSAVLDFYQQQAHEKLSPISWFARLQKEALQEFARLDFPTRRQEEWKYTVLDTFMQHRFQVPTTRTQSSASINDGPDLAWINIVNGTVEGLQNLELPKGVIIQPLLQAMDEHEEKVKACFNQTFHSEHAFHALNTAFLHSGLFIYVPREVSLQIPLGLAHWQDINNQAVYSRHLLYADVGSEITLIEDYQGKEGCTYFTNNITEVYAAEKARVQHYKIQRESKTAFHFSHLTVKQEDSSQLESHSLSLGGKLVRSDINVNLEERHSNCLLNGIYAPSQGQHIDHHTLIHHKTADCQSVQDYKGILSSNSRAVFNGKVVVDKEAQHTQANQSNKNLLLSTNAEIDTKPQLDIFADDVVCTHGATVGQLDENALFYLAARGIDKVEANHFLIQAFAAENLQRIAHKDLAVWMSNLLSQQIG